MYVEDTKSYGATIAIASLNFVGVFCVKTETLSLF